MGWPEAGCYRTSRSRSCHGTLCASSMSCVSNRKSAPSYRRRCVWLRMMPETRRCDHRCRCASSVYPTRLDATGTRRVRMLRVRCCTPTIWKSRTGESQSARNWPRHQRPRQRRDRSPSRLRRPDWRTKSVTSRIPSRKRQRHTRGSSAPISFSDTARSDRLWMWWSDLIQDFGFIEAARIMRSPSSGVIVPSAIYAAISRRVFSR